MSKSRSFSSDPEFHTLRAQMGQAIALQQRGQFAAAELIYEQILAKSPDQPDALHFLGLLKHQAGKGKEALRLMAKSLELGQPNAGYLYNMGNVLRQQGFPLEAIRHLQQAVELTPSNADAWNQLGECRESLGMHFNAVECYRKAYALNPGSPLYASNLARGLHNTGEYLEGIQFCGRYLEKHPNDVEMRFALINSLLAADKVQEAIQQTTAALREDPLSLRFQHVMGTLMAKLGNFDAAKQHYEKAIAIDPQFYAGHYNLAAIQRFAPGDASVADFEKRIAQTQQREPTQQASAEFALGKMLDDQQEYDRAFTHFERGNKLIRSTLKYSTSAMASYMDSLAKHLGADFVAARAGLGSADEKPVFILGMMRSGSSLVEQILAAHPQVTAGGELSFLPQAVRRQTESPTVVTGDKIAALPDAQLRAIADQYLGKIHAYAPDAARVTDKLPGNFLIIGLIRALFPKAHIIHCTRDPLDTCLSCYFTHFDASQPYAYDLTEIGEYHQLYQKMMQSQGAILGGDSMLTVKYEELVSGFEAGARRLVEYCGLEWDPRCLEFMKVERPVATASLYQVRQAPYQSSIGRWKHYAAHIGPLQKALADDAG